MPSRHRTSQGSFKYYGPGLDGGEESKEAAVSRVAEEVVPVRGIPSIVCTCYVLYCTVANLLSIPGTVHTNKYTLNNTSSTPIRYCISSTPKGRTVLNHVTRLVSGRLCIPARVVPVQSSGTVPPYILYYNILHSVLIGAQNSI